MFPGYLTRTSTGRASAILALAGAILLSGACASGGGGGNRALGERVVTDSIAPPWSIRTRDNIDLWLHAFSLLQRDTARVPLFRPGYRDELLEIRRQRNVSTKLDENRERLAERLNLTSALWNSQFLAIYFADWKEMKEFMDLFSRAEGDPDRSTNPTVRRAIGMIGQYFPNAVARDWARLFVQSVDDEYQKFYRDYWTLEQQHRQDVRGTIDSLWRNVYHAKFRKYLDGSQQRNGDLILSLPLHGEGRLLPGSVSSPGGNYGYLAVNFPSSSANAIEAIYTFAHEVAGRVVTVAVNDHTTPAEARTGLRERYESDGLVVGGYFLLKKIAPEIAEGYARYYLAGIPATARGAGAGAAANPETALLAAFQLPDLIRDSILRQIDIVLSGI